MDITEKIELKRHDEMLSAMGRVVTAITSLPTQDPELNKLLKENKDAIDNFVRAVGLLKNQEGVVEAIKDLGKIVTGFNERIISLEAGQKPIPIKLRAIYSNDRIEYVVIEYKNTGNIKQS